MCSFKSSHLVTYEMIHIEKLHPIFCDNKSVAGLQWSFRWSCENFHLKIAHVADY